MLNRIRNFYPYYVIAVFFSLFIVEKTYSLNRIISALLFLPAIGITTGNMHALWFLGAYTYVFAFYLCLFKIFSKEQAKYIIGLISVCMAMLMMKTSPVMNINLSPLARDNFIGFIPFGIARGVTGMGAGFLIGELSNNYNKNPFSIMATPIEFFCLGLFIYIVLHEMTPCFDMIAYLVIGVLIFSLNYKNSFFSHILEKIGQKFERFFSLSMPIYIFHELLIRLAGEFLKAHFREYNLYIVIYLLFVLMLAVVMRFLYEKILFVINKLQIQRN